MRIPLVARIAAGIGYLAFGISAGISSFEYLSTPFLWISLAAIFVYPLIIKKLGSHVKFDIAKMPVAIAIVLTAFEILSLATWVVYPIFYSRFYEGLSWIFAHREALVTSFVGQLSPYLLVLLAFGYFVRPIADPFRRKIVGYLKEDLLTLKDDSIVVGFFERHHKLIFVTSLILPVIILAYAYIPTINPDYTVGVDIEQYIRFNSALAGSATPADYIQNAFLLINEGDRALTLIAINALTSAFSPWFETLDIIRIGFSVILGPLLVFSVYIFVSQSTGNKQLALVSSLVAALSHNVIVGIYAGFLANWLALCVMFFLLTFLSRLFQNKTLRNFLISLSLAIVLLFTHIYTWNFVILVLAVFLAILGLTQRNKKIIPYLVLTGIIIAASMAVDQVWTYLGAAGGLAENIGIAESETNIENFAARWNNLKAAMGYRFGGALENTLVIGMAVIWVLLSKRPSFIDTVILAFLVASMLPLLFGNLVVQSRVIYNLPFYIPVAILLWRVINTGNKAIAISFFVFFFVYLVNYALRNAANFYLILPS